MFARSTSLRPVTNALRVSRARPPQPRRFTSSAIQTLTDGFLDLAIALPYPPSLPPYSTTIILVTVASRLIFTVPFSVWVCDIYVGQSHFSSVDFAHVQAKNRQWKAENVVMPELQREIPQLNKQVIAGMKAAGYRGELVVARKERNKRLKQMVMSQRNDPPHPC